MGRISGVAIYWWPNDPLSYQKTDGRPRATRPVYIQRIYSCECNPSRLPSLSRNRAKEPIPSHSIFVLGRITAPPFFSTALRAAPISQVGKCNTRDGSQNGQSPLETHRTDKIFRRNADAFGKNTPELPLSQTSPGRQLRNAQFPAIPVYLLYRPGQPLGGKDIRKFHPREKESLKQSHLVFYPDGIHHLYFQTGQSLISHSIQRDYLPGKFVQRTVEKHPCAERTEHHCGQLQRAGKHQIRKTGLMAAYHSLAAKSAGRKSYPRTPVKYQLDIPGRNNTLGAGPPIRTKRPILLDVRSQQGGRTEKTGLFHPAKIFSLPDKHKKRPDFPTALNCFYSCLK